MNSLIESWIRRFPKGSIWQTRFICLPVMIVLSTWAFTTHRFDSVGVPVQIALYALGAFTWTFLEYCLHRWVLHYTPKGPLGKAMLDRLHIFHHQDPKDQSQVCIPPSLVLPAGVILFGISTFVLRVDLRFSIFFLSGLMTLLVIYDITHFSTHYMPASNGWLQRLKKHHMLHHFSDHHGRFGVTSPFWDYVFRTLP